MAYLERRLRVYASGLLAANSHQPASCDVPVYYLRTSESRDLGVSWESVTTTGKYQTLDVDSTHSSLWYDKVVTAALAGFLEQSRDTASERTGLWPDLGRDPTFPWGFKGAPPARQRRALARQQRRGPRAGQAGKV